MARRKDPKQTARDAIVGLRQQLQMIEKKEEYLQKKIEEETKKARTNAVSNKAVAMAALKRKKVTETELDRLAGTRLQLEMQVNTLESANLNAETMAAMKKASDALKVIHGNMTIDKVDATMAAMNEQRDLANEIANSLADPVNAGMDVDDEELMNELDELQQDELNNRLNEADHVPVHLPPGSRSPAAKAPVAAEDDEEAQLKELQAQLAILRTGPVGSLIVDGNTSYKSSNNRLLGMPGPTKHEYTSTLRAIKYECAVPVAEVIARLNKAVNKAGTDSEGPLPQLQKLREQGGLEEYVATKSGDHFLYFNDVPFHKLPSIAISSFAGDNKERPLVVTYTIGDPRFAQQILARNQWAAVCIPPRLLVVEKPDRSGTSVYFHTASSIMAMAAHEGQRDEELEKILEALDKKLEALVVHITAEMPEFGAAL
ncbi:hypothetical protein D9619_000323 [Psilocybe cf. subviscida]|uniref:Vacuolar-sorting protein SNF7 n=1 Tax=Psilocybe cf. subviscida TaxID=2480587 RepID=A0A8H5BFU4_9AGAR|nr:hypothetical protein D9619_000323 [Psilocybe cf. subviscida]